MSGPPAPPPPPPPGLAPPAPKASVQSETTDVASALFAEINSLGEDGIRGGLKKATRGPVNDSVPVHSATPVTPVVKPAKAAIAAGGAPKCELQGKKWVVEYQTGNKDIVIEASMKQTVYVFKCHDCLIKVDGKVNAIVLDNCTKSACIFEEAMASIEIVNSKDIQVQCTKNAPAMSIDGCTAVTYYMSPTFANSQIITAKSAAINLIRPTADDDIVETPIPEQFCTTWKDGSWVTDAVSHDD